MRLQGIICTGKSGNRVKHDYYIIFILNQALGFLYHHLSNLNMAFRRLIKGG